MVAELSTYITTARGKNVPDDEIKNQLIAAGWPSDQVTAALSPSSTLPVPPPPPSIAHVGMWVGFLYILFFVSLYVLATAIGGIYDVWVDKAIPDLGTGNSFVSDFFDNTTLVQGYLAGIIVSYPLFMTFLILLKKQLTKQPLVANLRSRKILIYITLIGTFLIMLGNVIATIFDFLTGTVTNNVLGHLCVTILIAGSIFIYFLSEVKHDRKNV